VAVGIQRRRRWRLSPTTCWTRWRILAPSTDHDAVEVMDDAIGLAAGTRPSSRASLGMLPEGPTPSLVSFADGDVDGKQKVADHDRGSVGAAAVRTNDR